MRLLRLRAAVLDEPHPPPQVPVRRALLDARAPRHVLWRDGGPGRHDRGRVLRRLPDRPVRRCAGAAGPATGGKRCAGASARRSRPSACARRPARPHRPDGRRPRRTSSRLSRSSSSGENARASIPASSSSRAMSSRVTTCASRPSARTGSPTSGRRRVERRGYRRGRRPDHDRDLAAVRELDRGRVARRRLPSTYTAIGSSACSSRRRSSRSASHPTA